MACHPLIFFRGHGIQGWSQSSDISVSQGVGVDPDFVHSARCPIQRGRCSQELKAHELHLDFHDMCLTCAKDPAVSKRKRERERERARERERYIYIYIERYIERERNKRENDRKKDENTTPSEFTTRTEFTILL